MNASFSARRSLQEYAGKSPSQHADRVVELVGNKNSPPNNEIESKLYPVDSWRRCLEDFKLDPAAPLEAIPHVGQRELNLAREAAGEYLPMASDELVELFSNLRGIGYSTSLANHEGLFILEQADRDSSRYVSTDQPGWMWPEHLGGTNSVGTCIVDEDVTSVFGAQHFFSICSDTACAGAPIFDPDGVLWGIFSITMRDSALQFQTHALATQTLKLAAMRLSARLFRRKYANSTIVDWRGDDGSSSLLAVNSDLKVEGANRTARRLLGLEQTGSVSKPLWNLFEKNNDLRKAKLESGTLELRTLKAGKSLHVNVSTSGPSATRVFMPGKASKPTTPTEMTLVGCAGSDPAMLRNINILRKVRNSGLPILLLGETGTGKDTLARAIHGDGTRAGKPFVAFNCAAIPESLIDAELFGYAPGTFTGASPTGNRGRILEADGGTLFLDEIGDMPLLLQTRLLRVLEHQEVVALGTGNPQKVDLNIIAATHQNLHSHIADGRFREDLYYRLAGAVIEIPALRDRVDRREIIERTLSDIAGDSKRLDAPALQALLEHSWPGNLRELSHVLRRATVIAEGETIYVTDLMLQRRSGIEKRVLTESPTMQMSDLPSSVHQVVWKAEQQSINAAMREAEGDVQAAAKLLGVSRATLYRKLQRQASTYLKEQDLVSLDAQKS